VVSNALGIPCSAASPGDVQRCRGNFATARVPSWDGVPLDTDVTLPPAQVDGPYPTIFNLHGFGATKESLSIDADAYARAGYAVVSYTARGLGGSCGVVASRAHPGCVRGWIHLADARYELRDTQHLAGLLVDAGLSRPSIGAVGVSYGGIQSYALAALRDRVMTPDGVLHPWRSPAGTPMQIGAAAPRIAPTDIAFAAAPNGNTLDLRAENPYGRPLGVMKLSSFSAVFGVGLIGYYAPPGADPSADVPSWYARIQTGEPYGADVQAIVDEISGFHSPYYRIDSARQPAPVLSYHAWTDDIVPANEGLRWYNRVKRLHPGAEVSMVLADGFAHPRGSLLEPLDRTPLIQAATRSLFDRHLKGAPGPPLGVATLTQACASSQRQGPFVTPTWSGQSLGEVSFQGGPAEIVTSAGGNLAKSARIDPIAAASSCIAVPDSDDPGTAVYRLPRVQRDYTLLGSPTVQATLDIQGPFAQLIARLWDVGPDGSQALVTRAIVRPDPAGGPARFQLYPSGWTFRAGHVPKLELLGRDPPYARPSNGPGFQIRLRGLSLVLPTREPGSQASTSPSSDGRPIGSSGFLRRGSANQSRDTSRAPLARVAASTTGEASGSLPFTGLAIAVLAAIGAALLATGAVMRGAAAPNARPHRE